MSGLAKRRHTYHHNLLQCPGQTWLINHSEPTEAILVPGSFKQHSRQSHFIPRSNETSLLCLFNVVQSLTSVFRVNNNPFMLSNKEQTRRNFTNVLLKAASLGLTRSSSAHRLGSAWPAGPVARGIRRNLLGHSNRHQRQRSMGKQPITWLLVSS